MLTGRYIASHDCNRGLNVRYMNAREGVTGH